MDCLKSLGNAYGMGRTRVKELANAVKNYDGAEQECLDDFKDGEKNWDSEKIREKIAKKATGFKASVIVTFDSYGVSGHENHQSCGKALREFKMDSVRVLRLESVSILRKFTATLDLISTFLRPYPFVSEKKFLAFWHANITPIFLTSFT